MIPRDIGDAIHTTRWKRRRHSLWRGTAVPAPPLQDNACADAKRKRALRHGPVIPANGSFLIRKAPAADVGGSLHARTLGVCLYERVGVCVCGRVCARVRPRVSACVCVRPRECLCMHEYPQRTFRACWRRTGAGPAVAHGTTANKHSKRTNEQTNKPQRARIREDSPH